MSERDEHGLLPEQYLVRVGLEYRHVEFEPKASLRVYNQLPPLVLKYVPPPWWVRVLRKLAFWRRFTEREER